MTRRYPKLPSRILQRDAVIAKKIIDAWDKDGSADKALQIFLKEKNNLSDERYWELLRSVWIIAGSSANYDLFRELMLARRKQRHYFSSPEEWKKLREMPEEFTIYRAAFSENDGGLSWTLSEEYAKHYQKEFDRPLIITAIVRREHVFAYINRNLEDEIVLI